MDGLRRYVTNFDDVTKVIVFFNTFSVLGMLVITAWAVSVSASWGIVTILTISVILDGAAAMLGALLGFLFGIPRTLQDGSETAPGSGQSRQLVNTNLERVSDWLTTMLIGATLTQITVLPGLIWNFAGKIVTASTLTVVGFQGMIAGASVYYLIVGFFSGYLLTRLFLAVAFFEVQDRLNRRDIDVVLNKASQDTPATAEQIASAGEIVKKPLASLSLPEDVQAWAEAQKILGNVVAADQGFQRLIELRPDDAKAKLSYATVLDRLRQTDKADQMRNAAAAIQNRRLELSTINSRLYRPGEYQKAIDQAEKNIADGNVAGGEMYFLLSVAYAQKYENLGQAMPPDPSAVDAARASTIDNLRKAIAANPAYKERARLLWDPAYPKKDKSEDDFEIFNREKNADFEALLK